MKDLARVPIGTKITLPFFESRSDGAFESFRGPLDSDAVVVQSALIGSGTTIQERRRERRAWAIWLVLASSIFFIAWRL